MKKLDCSDFNRRNRDRQADLWRRAKAAYDAYTVAAGETKPLPFISLRPRQIAGWIAAVETLDNPNTVPRAQREEQEVWPPH